MKKSKRVFAMTLAFALFAAGLYPAALTNAAAKKTIYVVSSFKINNGKKTIRPKITYKNGFITKIASPDSVRTFSYNKKYQPAKSIEKILTGDFKGKETRTYTWKNNRLTKVVAKGDRDDKSTTSYSYKKNKIASAKVVSEWKEDGSVNRSETRIRYTYNKKGYLADSTEIGGGLLKGTYKYDKKNNVIKRTMTLDKKAFNLNYYNAKITYKNGRVSKMKTEHLLPMGMDGKPAKLTITLAYKKIKVNKSYTDRIAEQQWQLINQAAGLIGPSNGVEAFAF